MPPSTAGLSTAPPAARTDFCAEDRQDGGGVGQAAEGAIVGGEVEDSEAVSGRLAMRVWPDQFRVSAGVVPQVGVGPVLLAAEAQLVQKAPR